MGHKYTVTKVMGVVSAPFDLPEDASYDISDGRRLYQTNLASNADWLCSVLNGDKTSSLTFVSKALSVVKSPTQFMCDRNDSFLCFVEAEGVDGLFFVGTSRRDGEWLLKNLNNHLTNVEPDTGNISAG